MSLLVLRPGLSTTIQDLGRVGRREFGVPVGGAFDRVSFDLANALVGNEPDAAALEMTLDGGSYQARGPLAIALAGAPMSALIRSQSGPDQALRIPQSATLQTGDELILGGSPIGARTYLAVRGGWLTPLILGSRSSEVPIEKGSVLPAWPGSTTPSRRPVDWPWGISSTLEPIRVIDGPDADPRVGDAGLLESIGFVVSGQSDRMGIRLEGPPIGAKTASDRVSAPVAAGAVQIAGGQAIVLGPAGGTMGGYLHLAHVVTADLDRLGQLRPGERFFFRRVELEEARALDRRRRSEIRRRLSLLKVLSLS